MSDSTQGGNDTLIGGNNSGGGSIAYNLIGDADQMSGFAKGGNDTLTGGSNSGSGAASTSLAADTVGDKQEAYRALLETHPELLELFKDLANSRSLDGHPCNAHHVSAAEPLEIKVFDVLINDRNLMMCRDEGCEQGQAR
jgi:hypothetical protein